MKGVGKSREAGNVVAAQSSEMNSPFFRTYNTLHVLLKFLDNEIEYRNSVRCEWVIVRTQSCSAEWAWCERVCLRVSVRVHGVHEEGLLDPTEFLSRDVCGREDVA